jgi:hypothetical protein
MFSGIRRLLDFNFIGLIRVFQDWMYDFSSAIGFNDFQDRMVFQNTVFSRILDFGFHGLKKIFLI